MTLSESSSTSAEPKIRLWHVLLHGGLRNALAGEAGLHTASSLFCAKPRASQYEVLGNRRQILVLGGLSKKY